MKIEQMTNLEIVEKMDSLDLETAFRDIEEAVLRSRYEWPQGFYNEIYWEGRGENLKYFIIEKNSIQPLEPGEFYVASLACGADAADVFASVIETDENDDEFILHEGRKIPANEFVDLLFSDECDLTSQLLALEEEFKECVEGRREDRLAEIGLENEPQPDS